MKLIAWELLDEEGRAGRGSWQPMYALTFEVETGFWFRKKKELRQYRGCSTYWRQYPEAEWEVDSHLVNHFSSVVQQIQWRLYDDLESKPAPPTEATCECDWCRERRDRVVLAGTPTLALDKLRKIADDPCPDSSGIHSMEDPLTHGDARVLVRYIESLL